MLRWSLSSGREFRRRLARLLPRSVVARTSLGILVLAVVTGMVFSLMTSWRVRADEHDRLVERVHELTATVESTVSVACFLNDATLAKEIAGGLMKNRILAGVHITSGANVLHSVGDRAAAGVAAAGRTDTIAKTIYSPFDASTAV